MEVNTMNKFKPKIKEKHWDIKKEQEIRKEWEKNELYSFHKDRKAEVFSIDTPPPYPSGSFPISGVIHYGQIDFIARYERMKGKEVLFPPCLDRNGLPVEYRTEREHDVNMHEISRKKFLRLCRDTLDKYESEILENFRRIGLSFNSLKSEDYYRTDSPEYRTITQTTFIKLWKKGLIYEARRPNNWCHRCGTTLADAEVEYEEHPTEFVYIKFKVKETGEDLIIATTRPELLGACGFIIVHPQDDRYQSLHNKTAVTPIYGKEVPIIPRKEAKKEFGTGAMMVCSYGDYEDVRLFRKLEVESTKLINPNGKLSENAGKYAGMQPREARGAIIQDLKEKGLITKQETKKHEIPICYRCGTPLEFVPMKEYYLKQTDFLKDVQQVANELEFFPENKRKILLDWIDAVSVDWPISRRRFYGTEIPLWYCQDNHHPILPKPGEYYQPWKEEPPVEECPKCSCKEFVGEERTLDTWMDSSLTPLYISGYLQDEEFFREHLPVDLRPQAHDIIRTWLFYTILKSLQLTDTKPFKMVWIGNLVMGPKGEAMSKSKGNIILPSPLFEEYGADSIRLFAAGAAKPGENIKTDEDQINGAFKFLQKLWNISRFVSMFPNPKKSDVRLKETDQWILAELNQLLENVRTSYENFNFYTVNKIRDFVWNTFASNYLEMVKARAYGSFDNKKEQKGAWWTLHQVLRQILKMLAPIVVFMTDYIFEQLYDQEIHKAAFPEAREYKQALVELTDSIRQVNSAIWKWKKKADKSLKYQLEHLQVPEKLESFKEDLKSLHEVKELSFGDDLIINREKTAFKPTDD